MEPHELVQNFKLAIDETVWDQLGSRYSVDYDPFRIMTAPGNGEPWTFTLKFTLRQKYPGLREASTPSSEPAQEGNVEPPEGPSRGR